VPIVPGILPVQSLAQVQKITSMCGAKVPRGLGAELEAAGSEDAMHDAGVRWAVGQCRGLLEGGAPGVHFYVLNRAAHMERIVPEIRDLLVPPVTAAART
jgi:methylenetetrahydrofolate reductase (NADPH)